MPSTLRASASVLMPAPEESSRSQSMSRDRTRAADVRLRALHRRRCLRALTRSSSRTAQRRATAPGTVRLPRRRWRRWPALLRAGEDGIGNYRPAGDQCHPRLFIDRLVGASVHRLAVVARSQPGLRRDASQPLTGGVGADDTCAGRRREMRRQFPRQPRFARTRQTADGD